MTPRALPAAVCLLTAAAAFARQDGELPLLADAYKQAAAEIVKTLGELDQAQVRVGDFTPTGFDATSGHGVAQDLAAALEGEKKGVVNKDARYQVNGDVLFVESDAEPGQRVVQFNFRLVDTRSGRKSVELQHSFRVNGTKEIARIVQPDVRLDEDGTRAKRNKQIQAAVKSPAAVVKGPKVKAAEDSPYAVEVLVKNAAGDYAARGAELREGRAFVGLDVTDVFRVRVHNGSRQEVAVAVFVDGINCCHFCPAKKADGSPRFQHFIIDAGASQDVLGWLIGVKGQVVDYKEFLVTENGKGAASLVPTLAKGKVGAVTVQFAKCFEPVPGGRGGAEVGFGAEFQVRQRSLQRDIDVPFEFVNVRYAR